MSQLVVYNDDRANMLVESDVSYSDSEIELLDKKQTSKSIFYDQIAKDLVKSRDKTDVRLLKLHKFTQNSP